MRRIVTSSIVVLAASLGVALSSSAAHAAETDRTAPATQQATTAALGPVLFRPSFPLRRSLVTNEYALWNGNHSDAVRSAHWEMTSGSLFGSAGYGSTGPINAGRVDARSRAKTNSAVFRLHTKRSDFRNVQVSFNLKVLGFTSTPRTPAVNWDGTHVFLRYQSQYHLYYASVARRDGKVLIKKKCPGGSSNGGTYHTISREVPGHRITPGVGRNVVTQVRNNPGGSVTITLALGGSVLATATDTGVGCAPITQAGAVGIRGDNARFTFQSFTVRSL